MNLGLLAQFLNATILTLKLSFFSIIAGFILTWIFLFITNTKLNNAFFKIIIKIFCVFIRGTPILIQMFIIYYGLPNLAIINETFLWNFFKYPFFCATLTLALNNCAYSFVLFQGSINDIPKEQIITGKLLGLSSFKIFNKILFPQATKNIFPAYINELIIILKSTSLASSITILELTGLMNKYAVESFNPIAAFLICALIYYFINILLLYISKIFFYKIFRTSTKL